MSIGNSFFKLRSESDLKEYNKWVDKRFYYESDGPDDGLTDDEREYDEVCYKRNRRAWSLALIGLMIAPFFTLEQDGWLIAFLVFLGFLIAAMLCALRASKCNIMDAEIYDLPPNNKRLRKELNNYNIGRAAMFIGLFSSARHIKKNLKDIANVDSWQEMK